MRFCTQCGSELQGGKFCGECGAPVGGHAAGPDQRPSGTPEAVTPDPVPRAPGRTVQGPSEEQPVARDITAWIYPVLSAVLFLGVLFTPWSLAWRGVDAPSVWVVLATLLAIAAAVVVLAERQLAPWLKQVPLPLSQLRLIALAPLALLVLIELVRMLGEFHGLGPGVLLALGGIVLTAAPLVLDGKGETRVKIAAGLLGAAGVLSLWPIITAGQELGSDVGFIVFTVMLIQLGMIAWWVFGLTRRSFAEWAGMALVGVFLLFALFSEAGTGLTAASSLFTIYGLVLVLFVAGLALALAPGTMHLMKVPTDRADRWLHVGVGILGLSIIVGAWIALMSLLVTSFVGQLGGGVPAELILMVLFGVAMAVGSWYGRRQLFTRPARGRIVTLALAGAAALLTVVSALGIQSESAGSLVDISAGDVLLPGLLIPAILAGLMFMPAVTKKYGPVLQGVASSPAQRSTTPEPPTEG